MNGRRPGSSGAGAVGIALGRRAVAGRLAGPRGRQSRPGPPGALGRGARPRARAFAEPQALIEEVELIVVAIPDDALAGLAAQRPDVQRPGDGPHERRTWRRGAGAGDGRRDPGRCVPPAGRLRRHRAGGRPRCAERRSRSRATTSWRRSWPRWPRPIGATPVRLAAGLQGRLPRGGGPGGRWLRRAARRDRRARPRRRAGRGRFAGDLRAAHRGDAGATPGPWASGPR